MADGASLSATAPGRYALAGELGFTSVAQLWPQGLALFKGEASGGDRVLEVDLSGVRHADSAGLALLVAWQAGAQAVGCRLRFTALPDRLMAIARISEAESLLVG